MQGEYRRSLFGNYIPLAFNGEKWFKTKWTVFWNCNFNANYFDNAVEPIWAKPSTNRLLFL